MLASAISVPGLTLRYPFSFAQTYLQTFRQPKSRPLQSNKTCSTASTKQTKQKFDAKRFASPNSVSMQMLIYSFISCEYHCAEKPGKRAEVSFVTVPKRTLFKPKVSQTYGYVIYEWIGVGCTLRPLHYLSSFRWQFKSD